eukprot:5386663-Alexandrium_andersonii.AAC.1
MCCLAVVWALTFLLRATALSARPRAGTGACRGRTGLQCHHAVHNCVPAHPSCRIALMDVHVSVITPPRPNNWI